MSQSEVNLRPESDHPTRPDRPDQPDTTNPTIRHDESEKSKDLASEANLILSRLLVKTEGPE